MKKVDEVEAFLEKGETIRAASLDILADHLASENLGRKHIILKGLEEAIQTGLLVKATRGGFRPKPKEIGPLLSKPYHRWD